MLSNCYHYGLILSCCISALEGVIALFAETGSDSLMEVEKQNLLIFLKDLLATAKL